MTADQKGKLLAIASDLSAFLTLLAALPYNLGEAATYLPPNAKAWIAGVGVFATLGLRLIKTLTAPPTAPEVKPFTPPPTT